MNKQLTLIFILIALTTACFPDTYGGLENFHRHMKDAEDAELHGDYTAAEASVKSAEGVARDIKWDDGIVSARMRLAQLYISTHRLQEAEQEDLEALNVCSTIKCERMGLIYDDLFFLYSYHLRDGNKIEKIIDEVIAGGEQLDPEQHLDERLKKYSGLLRGQGLTADAEKLDRRRDSLARESN